MYIIYKVGSSENVINTEAEKVLIYIIYLEMSNIKIDITKIRSHDYLELNTPTITRIYFLHFYTTFNYIYYFFYFFSDLLGYTLRLFYYIYTRPFYINFQLVHARNDKIHLHDFERKTFNHINLWKYGRGQSVPSKAEH